MFGLEHPDRPRAIAFDVIGTLFPLEPLRPLITGLGLPPAGLEGWFAAGCRDAFALAVLDRFEPFASVLDAALEVVLAEQRLFASDVERKAVIDGLQQLDIRAGADIALAILADAGVPAIALSNGSKSATSALLQRAGLYDAFAHIVSVEKPSAFKPRGEVYALAADTAGVGAVQLALVAAHAWDIQGAHAAGLSTAYLSADRPFSAVMHKPDVTGETLPECVSALLAL